MRFKLTLKKTSRENQLPASYQYELSACIYRIMEQADEQYSEFLHSKGYTANQGYKSFKLFSFSNLFIFPFKIETDRIIIQGERVHFFVSFYVDKSAESFIMGLFKDQELQLGDRVSQVDFRVETIEVINLPQIMEKMTYKLLSPIVVAQETAQKHAVYLHPDAPIYAELIKQNLIDKYLSIYPALPIEWQGFDFEIVPLVIQKAKAKLIKIKAFTKDETEVKGYHRFLIQITAPPALHELALLAGLGQKNALGFGCVEAVSEGRE
jgi:CRISPR-associated endoribonuclease Cas6